MVFMSEKNPEIRSMERMANHIRQVVLDMIYYAKSGHIGGDFSEMELLIPLRLGRSTMRYIMSSTIQMPILHRFLLQEAQLKSLRMDPT